MSQGLNNSRRGGRGGHSGLGARSKTKTVKPSCNPIFEEWLLEWKEDAVAKGSKMQYVYGKVRPDTCKSFDSF